MKHTCNWYVCVLSKRYLHKRTNVRNPRCIKECSLLQYCDNICKISSFVRDSRSVATCQVFPRDSRLVHLNYIIQQLATTERCATRTRIFPCFQRMRFRRYWDTRNNSDWYFTCAQMFGRKIQQFWMRIFFSKGTLSFLKYSGRGPVFNMFFFKKFIVEYFYSFLLALEKCFLYSARLVGSIKICMDTRYSTSRRCKWRKISIFTFTLLQ